MRKSPLPLLPAPCLLPCLLALLITISSVTDQPADAQVIGYTVSNGELSQVDLGTLQLTPIGMPGVPGLGSLDFAPTGTLYGVAGFDDERQLVTVDTESGAATVVGPLGIELERFASLDITFDACGDLWLAAGAGSSRLYSVNPASGATTLVGDMGREVFSLTASEDRILGLARVLEPPFGHELVAVDPLTAELSSPRRLSQRVINDPWIGYGQAGILWGLNSGATITPPEPALTWVIDPGTGGNRSVASASFLTRVNGLAVDRPHGICGSGACRPGAKRHCLIDRRFQVEVEWQDFAGNLGSGRTVPGASDESGVFWFFTPDNWEMQVKILDGCAVNERLWVFSSATTNVEFLLRVTDTATGEIREYTNPLGQTAATVIDTSAFDICPEN